MRRPNLLDLRGAVLCLGVVLGAIGSARAQDEPETEEEAFFTEDRPSVSFATVWDFRFARTDDTTGWLDAGLGKTRYGGRDDDARSVFRIPQASFVVATDPGEIFSGHLHVNLDLEPENAKGRYGWDRLRLIEGFAVAKWGLTDTLGVHAKGGLFFPPISQEHVGEAWSTFYTVTPSAINAWVGEEVRALGMELSLVHAGLSNELSVKGAAFWNNDPTGSLLAYRGFSVHDRQGGWRDQVPLPPIPSLGPGGNFSRQAPWVEPIKEVDHRPGFFGALSWENYQWFQLDAIYFDNKGIPDRFDGWQYAWRTRFANVGATVFLPADIEVVGQVLTGDTLMGFPPPRPRVEADYRSWFSMLSLPVGRHRWSLRYEQFDVWDRDDFNDTDSSDENGHAWTFAYWLSLTGEHRLGAELVRVASDRAARAAIGEPVRADELVFQVNLRVQF